MASSATTHPFVFDAAVLSKRADIPVQLVWSEEDRPTHKDYEELVLPVIDLGAFLSGEAATVDGTVKQVGEACARHGFFQVTNHGIDEALLREGQRCTQEFFAMLLVEKERAKRMLGEIFGYSSSFTGRFTTNLLWKETLTMPAYNPKNYLLDTLGGGFQHYDGMNLWSVLRLWTWSYVHPVEGDNSNTLVFKHLSN